MGKIAQRLAKQPFGGVGIAQQPRAENQLWRRWPDTDSTGGLYSNIGLVHAPGLVGRLMVPSHPLLSSGTVTLHPRQTVRSASRPRSFRSSSTSRSDSEYRRYQRTALRIRTGSVCRHLKIAGRVAIADCIRAHHPVPFTSCNTT